MQLSSLWETGECNFLQPLRVKFPSQECIAYIASDVDIVLIKTQVAERDKHSTLVSSHVDLF